MRETNNKSKYFPFWIATFVLILLISFAEGWALWKTNGHFCYPMDDTFIHLAMAKHLLKYGVWGISQGEFSGASSSILYPLFLTGIAKIVGLNIYIPFIINFICGILIVYVLFKILKEYISNNFALSLSLISIILFTPLTNLVILGMEHTFHLLFSLLLVYQANKICTYSSPTKDYGWLILWGFLNVATRYEGMFLVACVCLLLFFEKKWFWSIFLGAISALPIIMYGVFSLKNGGDFLPNTLLLKQENTFLQSEGIKRILKAPYEEGFWISSLLFLNILLIWKELAKEKREKIYIYLFLGAAFIHFLFPHFGSFYRYEAYLIPLGMISLSIYVGKNWDFIIDYLQKLWQKKEAFTAFSIIALFLSFPMLYRSITAHYVAPAAICNIYQQQIQMAEFLHKYYENQVVADNDIGAICYFTDVKNLDLFGLGSKDVFWAKRNKNHFGAFMNQWVKSKKARIALFYEWWFPEEEANMYKDWVKVGEWHLQNNYVCGGEVVSFFAVDSSEVEYLEKSLKAFEKADAENPKFVPNRVLIKDAME
jgi:hypothetical protein